MSYKLNNSTHRILPEMNLDARSFILAYSSSPLLLFVFSAVWHKVPAVSLQMWHLRKEHTGVLTPEWSSGLPPPNMPFPSESLCSPIQSHMCPSRGDHHVALPPPFSAPVLYLHTYKHQMHEMHPSPCALFVPTTSLHEGGTLVCFVCCYVPSTEYRLAHSRHSLHIN